MKTILALVAGLFTAHMLNAAEPIEMPANPLYSCNLSFQAIGDGFQVIGGEYTIEGDGFIQCNSQAGLTEMPVKITMNAAPLSLNVAIGHIEVEGTATDIPLYTLTPEALIGDYGITQANLAIGAGFGLFTGTKVDASDIVLPISLKLIRGLGLNFGLTGMTIQHATH
jgi:hypothetical protein